MPKKKSLQEALGEVVTFIEELKADNTVPKNVKLRLDNIISTLSTQQEATIKIHKALNEIDEISIDNNIEPYTRTQLLNIASILESINR